MAKEVKIKNDIAQKVLNNRLSVVKTPQEKDRARSHYDEYQKESRKLLNFCEKMMEMSCTEDFQGIRFFFIVMKYRSYQRCSRNQYRLMLHLMFHLLERSVKLCKDVR